MQAKKRGTHAPAVLDTCGWTRAGRQGDCSYTCAAPSWLKVAALPRLRWNPTGSLLGWGLSLYHRRWLQYRLATETRRKLTPVAFWRAVFFQNSRGDLMSAIAGESASLLYPFTMVRSRIDTRPT